MEDECEKIGCPFVTEEDFLLNEEGAEKFEEWENICKYTSDCSYCQNYRELLSKFDIKQSTKKHPSRGGE